MSKNILLVEYDESTIHAVKELFHSPAFDVAVAGDGETAKQLLRDRHFDLMITAAMLPRFHGFNLALAVSQEHPGIKIIIISAIYKGLEYRHQATTQYRADDFFEKPLEKDRLRNRVLELLNMSESELQPAGASSTRVPQFDTAKIPAPRIEDESDKLSSADIFGDIIQKIEQVPSFEIDLGEGKPAAHKPATPPPPPRRPDPGLTQPLKPPPPKAAPGPLGGDFKGRTRVAEPSFDIDSLRGTRKPAAPAASPPAAPAATQQRIDASLDGLKAQPQPKRDGMQKEMRRIEDEIARKFEDTLSGLGLGAARKPAAPVAPAARPVPPAQPPPAAKTVVMPEIKVAPKPAAPPVIEKPAAPAPPPPVERHAPPPPPAPAPKPAAAPAHGAGWRDELQDEVIDLGDASLLLPPEPARPAAPPPPPPPPPAAKPRAAEEATEVREPRPEKKPAEDNPNEVGDYVLLGMIARGGMAEIYKAKKKGVKGFEKVIAIKKILSGYGEDDKYIEMLVDEAKIAAELSHPNIVQIYDLGRKDNYYFIAMEYVLGKDLREIQTRLRERDKWFSEEIAIFLTIKILEALNYAHKAKDSRGRPLDIVHRDVSPPNILISYNGDVKLTDFGVSKASIKIHQTLSGALKGKLLYMSPEQACGESSIDYRSDLYSVGVLLFELLTGRKLFLDTSEMLVLKKVQNGEILNPRDVNPDIDPALEKILLTSLNKECDRRYQSAAAMIADLEAYVHKKYDRAPGPVHLSHFLYGLFESDIQREGIKVDLKPLPYVPRPREVPKPPPAPEKPRAAEPPPPPPMPASFPEPPAAKPAPPEGGISISFDEDKAPAARKTAAAEKPGFQPESLFHELDKEKKKFPLLPVAAVLLLLGAAAAGVYFLVLNKPSTPPAPAGKTAVQGVAAGAQPGAAAAKEAEMKRIAEELAATQKLLDEAKLKEEALKKQQAEEDQKKLLEERRKKTEADRLKKEEEARLQQEEADRLQQQQEEERRRQEEADRQKQAEEEKRKADEQKRAEMNRVKEGDVVPLNEVDVQPVALSTPQPNIPDSIRAAMSGSQTVTFSVLINHNGDVETVRMLIKTNNGQLNSILIDTVKSYKFQPAQKNSLRVKVWKSISMSIKK